jgi:alkylation response protein AidB-like acyl-CoA dehydrogenase
MSLPNRNNPYNFDAYLEWRKNFNYYTDDPFIQKCVKHYCGYDWEQVDRAARKISHKVSYRWRDMSDTIATPENRPYLVNYDGHNHRIDRIVRPGLTETLESEVFSEGLFSDKTLPWTKLLKMYLIYQNGEACISCPVTCTEGVVKLLERYADSPELHKALKHCKEGSDGHFAIGAQYLSEIQGGSDVPSNLCEAVWEGGKWRIYGQKYFCSATHADYAVVTAKPAGSDKIAIFLVPSWLPGDKEKEQRNGTTIDRIKDKMGTSELTTAELTLDGAVGYPVGPLERGLPIVVGVVLTYSRLTVGLSGAATMTRAAREAIHYAGFRKAFGTPIHRFPMVAGQLQYLDDMAKSTTAGAFKVYRHFQALEGQMSEKFDATGPIELKKRRFEARELVMLQKITAAYDATDVIRVAMSVMGGHGVMEDFSALPRLFRDAAINELWEGPRNVLLAQIHRDFQRMSYQYKPEDFVRFVLRGHAEQKVESLAKEFAELVAYPSLTQMSPETVAVCRRWDAVCADLFHAYQGLARHEVESA